jgi:hypothetical protein
MDDVSWRGAFCRAIRGQNPRLPRRNFLLHTALGVRILRESPKGGFMGKINVGRVILGGIVAGIVGDILDYPVDGIWLAKMWSDQMGSLGRPAFSNHQILLFMLIGIFMGIVSIWLYAAIRPRFGPSVKTAIYAGIVVWIASTLLPNFALMWVPRFFNGHLTAYTSLGAFFEIVIGTIAGAALYKED